MTPNDGWTYLQREGLDRLIDLSAGPPTGQAIPLAPRPDDLARLHRLIRERCSFTVLEFGVGHSTLVIADALRKNEEEWSRLEPRPTVRNRHLFQLFSVDASPHWLDQVARRLPADLAPRVHLHFSEVEAGLHQGQLCHFYKQLPNVVPDFVYLDGPDPKDVQGNVRGLSFQCDERTVMAADLLLMEPTFLPGLLILVDGRTNNARFLTSNFRRRYRHHWDRAGDVSTFELDEERLGPLNVLGSDFADPEAEALPRIGRR